MLDPGSTFQEDSAQVQYLKALGFRLVVGETDALLDLLSLQPGSETTATPNERIRQLHNIPSPTSVPQHPLEDFFEGAPPSWSDIYSGVLIRSDHYKDVVDLVHRNEDVIVSGIPASGKTTLLMQVATGAGHAGPVIMKDGLSEEEARIIVRQLAGHPALVLLDNVANDIEALAIFRSAPEVTVVAADRDYNLGTVSHRLGSSRIVRVTDLSRKDLQAIWHTIPPRLRRPNILWPDSMAEGVSPSLFEFTETNITSSPLAERVVDAVRELNETDPELSELLLVACYVHYCRTPLAMDTIIAYFGSRISDYRELYEMIRRVGELLHEYDGGFAIERQDYFAARSIIVAESVLLEGSFPSMLKQVLTNFHRNVSPVRVAGHHIFRRRAFDSRLFLRAFRNTAEGVDIYDWVSEKYGTSYVLQQKALFLADRKQFGDAFAAIDRARSEMRRANWTIENSYYKILFKANHDKVEEHPDARQLLDRALDGLADCFKNDNRKGMHALAFGDCALLYTSRYRDDRGYEYLTKARQQLEQVAKDEPILERPKYLLPAINKRFREFG